MQDLLLYDPLTQRQKSTLLYVRVPTLQGVMNNTRQKRTQANSHSAKLTCAKVVEKKDPDLVGKTQECS